MEIQYIKALTIGNCDLRFNSKIRQLDFGNRFARMLVRRPDDIELHQFLVAVPRHCVQTRWPRLPADNTLWSPDIVQPPSSLSDSMDRPARGGLLPSISLPLII